MSTPTTLAAADDNIGGHKVDDRVRMFRNASGHDGENGTVRALDRDHGWRVWVNPDGAPYGLAVRMDPDDLERILAEVDLPAATPGPLDPTLVKAGDTVTLEVDPPDSHPAFTVAGETHSLGGSTVYVGGWRVDALPDYVTLTDHQPAPEPAPEWNPGTSGTATVRGVEGVRVMRTDNESFPWATGVNVQANWLHASSSVTDFVPDEPRPLPTRGELYAELTDGDCLKTDPRSGLTYIDPNLATERLAVFLRGESR